MPLFGGKQKSPQDLVKNLRDSLQILANCRDLEEKKAVKASEEVSKTLVSIKNMLYGTGEQDPQTELNAQLAQEMYNNNMLQQLIVNLARIDFEGKKDVAQIFNNLLRRQIGTRTPTVDYICQRGEIIKTLMKGYENQEIALNCGMMLRECCRHEDLARMMLYSDDFYMFFNYVEVSTFAGTLTGPSSGVYLIICRAVTQITQTH